MLSAPHGSREPRGKRHKDGRPHVLPPFTTAITTLSKRPAGKHRPSSRENKLASKVHATPLHMGALILPKQLRSPLPLEPLLLFLFAAVALIGLCATAALRKRREREEAGGAVMKSGEALLSRWVAFKKAWHRAHEDASEPAGAVAPETVERSTPALPLWQRRILMGERCEMPQFSGLILYDEHGRPLCSNSKKKSTPTVTTLKDLL